VNKGRNRQHLAALEAALLAMTGAFTAHQLHACALVSRPTLSVTTAYRAIHRWQREQRLHPAGTRHGHRLWISHEHYSPLQVVCSRCGTIAHLDPALLDDLREQARRIGFELADERLRALHGFCGTCRPTIENHENAVSFSCA
jgi:Fe2+ or Zn2+ uptake regulation protein